MSNTPIFINEIHYNNFGVDVAEGIEIAGPAGTNLAGWSLHLYEGGSGKSYKVYNLKGLIPNLSSGFGVLFFHTPGIKNGKNDKGDGIAFVDKAGKVAQFISYGGKTGFKAEDGPATNLSSSRIPFEETEFSSWTDSLQLAGTGCFYEDFHWNKPSSSSKGRINREQKFVARPAPVAPSNENAPEPVSQPSNPIQVTIDPKTEQNRTKHWTSKYHTEDLFVVRRGFSFEISVSSAEDLVPADVSIVLTSHPDTDRTMTLKVLDTPHSVANPQWNAFLDPDSKNQTKRNLDISIGIPPDAIIGEYSMSVDIKGTSTRFPAGAVVVLFNPWCDRDTVFMADQSWREEYILNETGFIWVGTELNSSPRAWNFAQFDTKSLLAALSLVEKIPRKERKDSVLVARRMSALCNASHDDGVLVGNWSGNFEGGTRPTAWSGSAEILKQYYLTKQPVKYGQCWVFSGVVTAVCRSIGIPTRSITNFASAHDTGFDRNIDKYYKRDNHEVDDSKTSDSIWNFHVWNDVWMRRPDLNNPENDGWQAIDATPQELSEGTYQTGPVSLSAIKNGAKDAKYDGEFVFSEVNADVREFVENEDGTDYILVQTYPNAVGKKISTKAVGSGNREDITLQYKYAEGSVEERIAFGESNTNLPEDVFLSLAAESVTMDKPVQAVLTLKKTAPQPRTVRVIFSAQFVHYTGRGRQQLSSLTQNVVLDSESKSITLTINPNEYQNSLNANRTIIFRAFISVSETKQVGLVSRTFEFTEPPINFSLPQGNKIKLGQTGKITVKFSNPLSIPLTRAVLSVEGQNLTKVQRFRFESIPAKGDLQHEVEIQGWAIGKNWLIATFECDQLTDIEDHIEVVTEK